MRLDQERQSTNVEDRRGLRMSLGLATGGDQHGCHRSYRAVLRIDPSVLLQGTGVDTTPPPASQQVGTNDEMRDFVSRVLGSTERTWGEIFEQSGQVYQQPKLVLFSDAVQSACGFARAVSGPFYCSEDYKIYIDLDFYRELRDRFRAPGDFAQAYVIAHEIGHHVQNQLGIINKVNKQRTRASQAQGNALSVRLELQADCLAGIWASSANRAARSLRKETLKKA
jgi:uncharacterized protein